MIYAVLFKQFLLQMGAHVGGVDGVHAQVKCEVLAKIINFCIFTASNNKYNEEDYHLPTCLLGIGIM